METRFLTVKQFAKAHEWLTEAALRAYIYNSNENGLKAAIVRVGRRILIDEKLFIDWINSHKEKK